MRNWIDLFESFSEKMFVFSEYPPEVRDHVVNFARALKKQGYRSSLGSKRVAMISPDKKTVVKIPRNDAGIRDNNKERRAFENNIKRIDTFIPIAACRVFFPDPNIGIPMLMMRYVEPITSFKNLPDWTHCVDCLQVGHDPTGKLVAYDL